MFSHIAGLMPVARRIAPAVVSLVLVTSASAQSPAIMQTPAQPGSTFPAGEQAVHRVQSSNERMEMIANSSRIITLDQSIPRAQVNNREVLELTALSPNEIQVFAKKPGVTQINLWNDKGQVYTIDCIVFGDARELAELIRSEFPNANIKVMPLSSSVWLSGYVDRPDQVSQIISLAQDYYPTVKSNIEVVGVQQILLHVKVAEVSRTKLRNLGFDFAEIPNNDFVVSSVSGLIAPGSAIPGVIPAGAGDTVRWGIVDTNNSFFGFLEALRRYDCLKVLADPTLVTVSGRPAYFKVGGQFPILVPQSLGTVSIEYKDFGTQLDFVPIVLGNGNVRLEVRPRVSEIDNTRSILINGTVVPGLRIREADTGVELKAGQTLAIAGLVQTRTESSNRGIPWLADLPYVGAAFRRMHEETNEVELLILVTPELAQGLDPCDAPKCFPGMHTDSPSDCELYWKGYIEVPSKGPCGPGGEGSCPTGGPGMGPMPAEGPMHGAPVEEVPARPATAPHQAETGYTASAAPPARTDTPPDTRIRVAAMTPVASSAPIKPPQSASSANPTARNPAALPEPPTAPMTLGAAPRLPAGPLINSANAANRQNPQPSQDQRPKTGGKTATSTPGFIGPVGYDVLN